MTDKEIEVLFKSIDNFDAFHLNIAQRQNLKLRNGIEIKFKNDLTDNVDIYLRGRILTLDNLTFKRIINDLSTEKTNRDNQEFSRINKITEERLRNEIFELGGNKYKVHKEYLEYMCFASDIASLHGTYLDKLRDLIRIFNRENILIIDEKEICAKDELIDFLKFYGFKYIDKDLKLS